jgi:hypothetical protein
VLPLGVMTSNNCGWTIKICSGRSSLLKPNVITLLLPLVPTIIAFCAFVIIRPLDQRCQCQVTRLGAERRLCANPVTIIIIINLRNVSQG